MRTTHETRFNLTAKDKTKAVIKGAESNLKKLDGVIGKLAVGFGGLAGIGGIGLFISAQSKAAKQALSYADALNVSVESLTAWQFAGESVGLGADKISDIMKDSAEKIGDAFRNNAGEAKEALESLNLSIEDMNRLSPDKQLLEIAKALDEVGTQGEKIQILESLGNDASLLLPLLEDNAAELKNLMETADKTGRTLTRIEADKLADVDRVMRELKASTDGLAKSLAVALGPSIVDVVNWLAIEIPEAAAVAETAFQGLVKVIANVDEGVIRPADNLTKKIQGLQEEILLKQKAIADPRIQPDIAKNFEIEIARAESQLKEYLGLFDNVIKRQAEFSEKFSGKVRKEFESSAIIPGNNVGSADKRDKEDALAKKLQTDFDKINNALKSEEQRIAESHLVRQQILIDAEAAGIESIVPFNDLKVMLAQQHEDKLTAVVLKGLSDREKFQIKSAKAQTKTVIGELVGLTQGVAQHNKTMFNINKTAGIANALVGAYESFNRTMGAYPYPINIGLAGLSLAAGLAQVQAIRSTSFSGGGGGTTPSAAGGVPTINDTPVPTLPNSDISQPATTEVNLTIVGGLHNSEDVRTLIEAINDEIGDGVQLNATVT